MKLETAEVVTGLDRLATNEEIRMAISLLPDFVPEVGKDSSFEAASDLGGYVHVDMGEQVMELFEEVKETVN